MSTRVRSFAKINLGLAVGPGRRDGFHGLTTIYQTLALHDVVTVSARRAAVTQLRLTADSPRVPTDARNTAWKMVAGALARMGVAAEVEIAIEKRLPVQGGLGAGSANAVAALLGLERELGAALACDERLQVAAEVGSDVPLFLVGGTVLGLGRGEEVYALPDSVRMACVVAVPEVGVSTAAAFREIDARMAGEGSGVDPGPKVRTGGTHPVDGALTLGAAVDKLKKLSCALADVCTTGVERSSSGIAQTILPEQVSGDLPAGGALKERDVEGDLAESPILALVRTGIENDFEEVAFSQHPSLRSIKRALLGSGTSAGAVYAALSGSGSALFGLYRSEADARAAQQRVQQAGTRAILTETLSRTAYWGSMFEV